MDRAIGPCGVVTAPSSLAVSAIPSGALDTACSTTCSGTQPVPDPGDSVAVRLTAWVNYDVPDETWDWLEAVHHAW